MTAGGATVGIRWPGHPFIQAVIRECGFPLAAPSALRFIPAWNPAPVFAALCLLVLAWALLAPQANFDLMGGMLGLFDMESLGQMMPVNLQHLGMLS